MAKSIFMAFFGVFFLNSAHAELHTEIVDYQIAGKPFRGYLSYDKSISGKRPGVLVVHEWWGHNAYAQKRAKMLAALGYTAFALDMYGLDQLATHPDDANKMMQAVVTNMQVAEQRFENAKAILLKHPTVIADKIAAIGYCFGGGMVLHMARTGNDLAGVVSFHGSLAMHPVTENKKITAQILVLNGADDPLISKEQITAFKNAMKAANATYQFINYPGVKHSFTNPGADEYAAKFNMPLAYNAKADQDSWQRMQDFLQKVFE